MSQQPDPTTVSAGSGTVPNAEQADAWDGDDGRHWVTHRQRYDTMLRRLTPHLLDAAAVTAAERVLDIGCGSGETTCAVARAARHGLTLGVDLSGALLDEARDRAIHEGLHNVAFEQGDAQLHPFPAESHDVAMSRFGVMFFDDPTAAFANIARALRPGGRLAFLCWQDVGRNEWIATIGSALAAAVELPAMGGDGPGPFSLADPRSIRELLDDTGFVDASIAPLVEPMRFGEDVDDVIGFVRDISLVRTLLSDADEETTTKASDAMRTALAPHQSADGILLGGATWLVTANRR
ncbi:MAG: methyltransferase domain-containing protein [Pseudonocardiaceae bacterium]|nr:methyltransferase domain-containing protein [Pseudonocardiaceae bacterium]